MALICILLDKYSGQYNDIFSTVCLIVVSIMSTVPMAVMIGFIGYKFIKKLTKWIPPHSVKEKLCCSQSNDLEAIHQRNNSDNGEDLELPDRVLHPEEYDEKSNNEHTKQNIIEQKSCTI